MRKIILIVIATLLLTNIGFAEMRLIEEKKVKRKGAADFYMATTCIDEHKFVLVGLKTSSYMVQAFEERDGKSLPTKC
jgi:hypothetical protein